MLATITVLGLRRLLQPSYLCTLAQALRHMSTPSSKVGTCWITSPTSRRPLQLATLLKLLTPMWKIGTALRLSHSVAIALSFVL